MAFRGRNSGSGNDVCHRWAHQTKPNGKSGNVFYEGDTIYSYGYHFPMGKILDDTTVTITTDTYSRTTSGHISAVRSAVSHMNIIYAKTLPIHGCKFGVGQHEANILYWMNKMKDAIAGHMKARKKEKWIGVMEQIRGEARKYVEYFKYKIPKKADYNLLFNTDVEGYAEGLRKQEEQARKRKEALVKKGAKLHPLWLDAWRNYKEAAFAEKHNLSSELREAITAVERNGRDFNHVRMRTDGITIHSSKGIQLPVEVGHRYYKKYLAVVKAGGCSNNCDYEMQGFKVKEMTDKHLLIGCHDILREDIDYLAAKLGWIK